MTSEKPKDITYLNEIIRTHVIEVKNYNDNESTKRTSKESQEKYSKMHKKKVVDTKDDPMTITSMMSSIICLFQNALKIHPR